MLNDYKDCCFSVPLLVLLCGFSEMEVFETLPVKQPGFSCRVRGVAVETVIAGLRWMGINMNQPVPILPGKKIIKQRPDYGDLTFLIFFKEDCLPTPHTISLIPYSWPISEVNFVLHGRNNFIFRKIYIIFKKFCYLRTSLGSQPVPLVKLVVIRTQEMLAGIGKTPLGMAYLAGDLPAVRCMGRIGHDRQGVLLSLCAGKKYVSGA